MCCVWKIYADLTSYEKNHVCAFDDDGAEEDKK